VSVLGLRLALLGAAGLCGLATLAPFVFPAWRQTDRRADANTPADAGPAPPPGRAAGEPADRAGLTGVLRVR
jgi:hypothetical protein